MTSLFKSFFIIICCLYLVACTDTKVPQLKPLQTGDLILAFGDSLTYGTGAAANMSYPINLEKILKYRVINSGMPGAETSDGVLYIDKILEQTHPKLVILCLGTNDLIKGRSIENIKDNLKKTIQLIQQSGAQVVLIAVPFKFKVPYFYQELGKELNIPIDTKSLVSTSNVKQFKADPIHLNNAGYKALAESIAQFLKQRGAVE